MNIEEAREILGIPAGGDLTSQVIRSACTKMILLYHPDKNSTPDAAEKILQVLEASRILEKSVTANSDANDQNEQPEQETGGAAKKLQKALFPPLIHIIQFSDSDLDPESVELKKPSSSLQMRDMGNEKVHINLYFGGPDCLISSRVMLQSLFLAYSYSQETLDEVMNSLKERISGERPALTPSNAITLVEDSSGVLHSIAGHKILSALTELELGKLLTSIGLKWLSQGKEIALSDLPIPLDELRRLGHCGFIVTRSNTELELGGRNGIGPSSPTQPPIKGEPFGIVRQYLKNTNWGIAPIGIRLMRKAAEDSSDAQVFFDAIKKIAEDRVQVAKEISETKGLFWSLKRVAQNKQSKEFYEKVVAAVDLAQLAALIATVSHHSNNGGGGDAKEDDSQDSTMPSSTI